MSNLKEYNPIGCEHKLDNGLSSWHFYSTSGGCGPQGAHTRHIGVCDLCGDIRVMGSDADYEKKEQNHYDETFQIYHPRAIDAIIKQANFFNEEVKWRRVDFLTEDKELEQLKAENGKMRGALEEIANWRLPPTGKVWDNDNAQPVSFEAEYGSNGVRDYMKQLATEALKTTP